MEHEGDVFSAGQHCKGRDKAGVFAISLLSFRIKSCLQCMLVHWWPRPSQEHHLLVPGLTEYTKIV